MSKQTKRLHRQLITWMWHHVRAPGVNMGTKLYIPSQCITVMVYLESGKALQLHTQLVYPVISDFIIP